MFAGFLYIPAKYVQTKYWLKIDTDAIAIGMDDWILPKWFKNDPVFVGHRWGFTKPANQMDLLDTWVARHPHILADLANKPQLNLHPEPGNERLSHSRASSWCAFFETKFTKQIAAMTEEACGVGKLPIASQDGFAWYCAKRMQRTIVTHSMKSMGWTYRSTLFNVENMVKEVLSGTV